MPKPKTEATPKGRQTRGRPLTPEEFANWREAVKGIFLLMRAGNFDRVEIERTGTQCRVNIDPAEEVPDA